jgi:pimeloyl-ACP methyl ester carboxylesterase
VPAYVLKHTMAGQVWLEGDKEYHSWLDVPTLLIHGVQDKLITIEEEVEMKEVGTYVLFCKTCFYETLFWYSSNTLNGFYLD